MLRLVILLVVFQASASIIYSQATHKQRGVAFSYYDQKIGDTDLDKDYLYRSMALSVAQNQRLFSFPIVSLSADFQTQLGATSIAEERNSEFLTRGIELALLLGLNVELSIVPKVWWLYFGGSIGPQFISNAPMRQNTGFIFSDSVYVGSRFGFSQNKQLDIKAGLRHQSNAGFSRPNGGLDSIFLSVGLFSKLKS